MRCPVTIASHCHPARLKERWEEQAVGARLEDLKGLARDKRSRLSRSIFLGAHRRRICTEGILARAQGNACTWGQPHVATQIRVTIEFIAEPSSSQLLWDKWLTGTCDGHQSCPQVFFWSLWIGASLEWNGSPLVNPHGVPVLFTLYRLLQTPLHLCQFHSKSEPILKYH